jgi:aspartyl aminopeptidase
LNGVVQDLIDFLDASPSPWHAAHTAATMLEAAGFAEIQESATWSNAPVAGFVRRGGALIAWRRAEARPESLRIVGAHTDSPGLRIHPHPDQAIANWRSLGVEIYGGALLNSWLDRDLGIAGRVIGRDGSTTLVNIDEPVARVPQLAIHLDRDVNEKGLLLDKHIHLRPVWSTGGADSGAETFAGWIADRAGVDASFWELCLYDVQRAAVLGADRSLIASGRLDNQLSCWAATSALAAGASGPHLAVAALFDHEEVGSASTSGAEGPILETVIDRLLAASGVDSVDDRHRVLAASSCISADNAHAIHPNYPERHDAGHAPLVNRGPAIKMNANQRYATDAQTAAMFWQCCEKAGVPVQAFVSRNNVPCGSTIGPITATRLGIATVDVGVPQLSMHSARELCGAEDPAHLRAALAAYWAA